MVSLYDFQTDYVGVKIKKTDSNISLLDSNGAIKVEVGQSLISKLYVVINY